MFLLSAAPSNAEWSATTAAKMLFTDNVYELSASRRLALSEDPSQPVRVSLDKPSDVVWQPTIDLRRASSTRAGLTELSFKADGFLYTNNPLFNHGDYRLQVRQQASPDTWVLFRYRFVPNLLLGPNFERQTGQFQLAKERVTEHVWRTQIETRLSEQWGATLVGRYGLRLYNDAFSERDTKFYSIGTSVHYKPVLWIRLTLEYLYEIGHAEGAHQMQYKDDVSYAQQFGSFISLIQLRKAFWLELTYVYRTKQFTSSIVGDPYNGTSDALHQGTVEVHYDLSDRARLTVGYQRTQRHSSLSSREFFNDNTSVGLEYRF